MGSTVITIRDKEPTAVVPKEKKSSDNPRNAVILVLTSLNEMRSKYDDMKKIIHSIKVGVALVLVSLLYLLDPLYDQVGENAMWAIMTVVVVFEFYAGATLSKGLNRGIGTILGGVLGCLAAILAQRVDGIGNGIIVGTSVFIFGAIATFTRTIPSIKKRYDYAAMIFVPGANPTGTKIRRSTPETIFILTFNLVVVSGLRAEKVLEIARERLSTIGMGFAVCIFTSLLVFPMWASDELHFSLASNFQRLASSIEGSLDDYFNVVSEKERKNRGGFTTCKTILYSKAKDESLANFAKWEPWHGKFGLSYPWEKYLKIGQIIRDLAANILSLKGCLQQSPKQASLGLRQTIKEPCEAVGSALCWTLRELEESMMKMRKCKPRALIAPKLEAMRLELSLAILPSKLATLECSEGLAVSSFVFLLMQMVDKVEELVKEVEELGELGHFGSK